MSSPNSHVEALTCIVVVFGGGGLEVIRPSDWRPHDGIIALIRGDRREMSISSPSEE